MTMNEIVKEKKHETFVLSQLLAASSATDGDEKHGRFTKMKRISEETFVPVHWWD